jgi:Domain of unknown function (DUF4062)
MDKRYTIFISSTYEDLRAARQEVIVAILQSHCFPITMEYFPASNHSPAKLIEQFLENSDYVILIIADKYGSVPGNDSEKSYTQMEYELAVEKGIPVLAFIRDKEIISAPDSKDQLEEKLKLEKFINTVKANKTAKSWKTPQELTNLALQAITEAKTSSPRPGWVRNNQVQDRDQHLEKGKIEQTEVPTSTTSNPLINPDDKFSVTCQYTTSHGNVNRHHKIEVSVIDILKKLGPCLSEKFMPQTSIIKEFLTGFEVNKGGDKFNDIPNNDFNTMGMRLENLGFIKIRQEDLGNGVFSRSWALTSDGVTKVQELAIPASPSLSTTKPNFSGSSEEDYSPF